jgi:ATP-dependent Clp protease adaptor protein ClpS
MLFNFLNWQAVQASKFFFGREPVRRVANATTNAYAPPMAAVDAPLTTPTTERDTKTRERTDQDPGYAVVCWDDPVNLMDYVTHVFQKVFGWPKPKAELHMLQVHNSGKSVLAREGFEKAEFLVHQLQRYHLHATLERDP